jgi:protein arginine kinase activator
LLERAHEGATHHVGKSPRRGSVARATQGSQATAPSSPTTERAAARLGTPEERSRRLVILRKQLADAVAAEQYERAASLRDELRRLSQPGERGGEEAP